MAHRDPLPGTGRRAVDIAVDVVRVLGQCHKGLDGGKGPERGAEVSMAEIAKAVGMSRQSIHLHFARRGGLLVAPVRRSDAREAIVEGFTAALKARSAAPRLDACHVVWFAFVVKIHPVVLDLIRLRTTDEEAARAWDGRMEELLRLFRLLVGGLKRDTALARRWSVQSAVDCLWTACSVQTWALLVIDRGWSEKQVSATIRRAMAQALLASTRRRTSAS